MGLDWDNSIYKNNNADTKIPQLSVALPINLYISPALNKKSRQME